MVPARAAALLLVLASTPALAARVTGVRILSLEKDSARLAVTLDQPGGVAVVYGEQPMAWSGEADSTEPATEHELRLDKLVPDRQYFYQVQVDGKPDGDVLTFHGGRSWVTRRAVILATGDAPDGKPETQALADALFSEEADVLLALGGDGGRAGRLEDLHRRAMTDRLVLAVGGGDDADSPRLVQISDVALGLLGDAPLAGEDGRPSGVLSWAESALPAVEGACWKVLATGRAVAAGSPDAKALEAAAAATGADVVLTRGAAAAVGRLGAATWVDVGGAGDASRHSLRLSAVEGALALSLRDAAGAQLGQAAAKRDCPIPRLETAVAVRHGSEDGEDDAASRDGDGLAEDCDSH